MEGNLDPSEEVKQKVSEYTSKMVTDLYRAPFADPLQFISMPALH